MPQPPRRSQPTLPIPQVIQQALALHQQGKRAEAEQLYEAVLKAQPEHFDALRFMGVLRSQQGRGEEAVKYIVRALERQPGSAEAHVNLASTLAKLNRHDEAIAS